MHEALSQKLLQLLVAVQVHPIEMLQQELRKAKLKSNRLHEQLITVGVMPKKQIQKLPQVELLQQVLLRNIPTGKQHREPVIIAGALPNQLIQK